MSLAELLPEVNELPRADKLRLLEFLASALVREEEGQPFVARRTCPIWSPYNSYGAAATLLQCLKAERERK